MGLLPQLLLLLLPLLLLAMQVLLLLEPQLHMPQQLLDKPIILMLLDPQQLRTMLNMELSDIKLSKPESNRLLLVMLMLLLDKKPSLSLLHHMLLVLHRTSLKPFLLLLQQSLLLLHLMLPFLLHLFLLVQLLLTLLSRPRLLHQSEPTPESHHKLPTLSHKSMSRNTTLMSPLLSHVLFPVRSLSTSMSLSLMRFLFPV